MSHRKSIRRLRPSLAPAVHGYKRYVLVHTIELGTDETELRREAGNIGISDVDTINITAVM